jgi:hypothetical protein
MPKARDYHLTEEELQIVEAAMKRDQWPGVRQRCWRHLKDRACANKLQDTIEMVMCSAEQALIEQNRAEQDSGFRVSKNL